MKVIEIPKYVLIKKSMMPDLNIYNAGMSDFV